MAGKTENAVAMVATLGATAVAKKVVDKTWDIGSHGKKPPTDPADPEVELREAIVFAVLSGAVISVVRMFLARRLARNQRREARAQLLAGG